MLGGNGQVGIVVTAVVPVAAGGILRNTTFENNSLRPSCFYKTRQWRIDSWRATIREYCVLPVAAILALFAVIPVSASAAIVDINARVYGLGNPIEVFLEAGTYSVTPIGTADGGAYNSYLKWASATCTDPNGCVGTVPTTVTGWQTTYFVTSQYLESAIVGGVMQDLSSHPTYYGASDGLYYPTDILALNNATPSTFTVNSNGMVGFYINDGLTQLYDNTVEEHH